MAEIKVNKLYLKANFSKEDEIFLNFLEPKGKRFLNSNYEVFEIKGYAFRNDLVEDAMDVFNLLKKFGIQFKIDSVLFLRHLKTNKFEKVYVLEVLSFLTINASNVRLEGNCYKLNEDLLAKIKQATIKPYGLLEVEHGAF